MSEILQSKKVLVIDDFREMRVSMRGMLKRLYAERVDEAADAEEALERIREAHYDVILCDYNLGSGKDGIQLLEEASHLGLLHPDTVFLMITAENSMDTVMAVVEYVPDGYLLKPVNPEVLGLRVERAARRKAAIAGIELALRERRYEEALAACDARLRRRPSHRLDLLRLRAEALLGSGDLEAAAAGYRGLADARPLPWALVGLARVQRRQGDLAGARRLCEQVIAEHPSALEAYDLLAEITAAQGDGSGAGAALAGAASVSPKSIRRQQRLADHALAAGDCEAARQAFRKAMRLGRHSCFARGSDVTGFAQSTAEVEGADAALRALEDHCKASADPALVEAMPVQLARAELLRREGREREARDCLEQALARHGDGGGEGDSALQLQLAGTCLALGFAEEAAGVVDRLVRANHDRPEVAAAAQRLFTDAGRAEQGEALIDAARKAVVAINNEGVRLAKAGKLEAAMALLEEAVAELPDNATVRLNLVQALANAMRAGGSEPARLELAGAHLARARSLGADPARCGRLGRTLAELEAAAVGRVA